MLNEMFKTVEQYEEQTKTKIDLIIVCGDCQTIRHHDDLTCLSVPNKYKKVGDFHQYYSGKKKIPRLTICIGGNHEASNYLMTLPYGGWVCDNFYYLGYAGVIKFRGLRIAGVSGIYSFRNHNRGRFERMPLDHESIKSVYNTRQVDVFRLQLLSRNAESKNPIDVFLSHDWPARVYDHGNLEQLLRFKPHFRDDVNTRDGMGSPLTKPLIGQLKPRRWFAAHMHCRFYAKIEHNQLENSCTEFLSLNKIENRNFVEYFDLEPLKSTEGAEESVSAECSSSQESEINNDKNQDNNLYYDVEWLTILRKTNALESYSRDKVSCPSVGEETGTSYFPTEEEIQETVEMMNRTGGLKIKQNFQMTEPVIYNRPGGGNPSIDKGRYKYFPNPQHEELCSRLKIESSLDQLIAKEGQTVESSHSSSSNFDHHRQQNFNNGQQSRGRINRHEPRRSGGDRPQPYRPNKKRAYELDEDGCLPFFVDKKGDR